ncbi:Enhancer of translation termination 1 [Wickerhamiella sorbophila]|uniref:Enhancer of translation termination 1 n=1 Tax=Wickerhamiella sorbophila TaxID=45607 RepID=A0A2T0FPU5_9ASCO|nr:Enhancer of translation termination 1 [Wickerhamiella sorbophila]PRT57016.1 Enhancer of translation termination 1 [Wickerhamiella sorbophila]
MAKRPLGLAKAAKLKKAKTETPEGTPEPTQEQKDAQLQVEVEESEPDEDLAELYGLFKTFDDGVKDSPKLAQGIVHESDRLLRKNEKLAPRFHLAYGLALLNLAQFADENEEPGSTDSAAAFIQAAIERLDSGLDIEENQADLSAAKALALVEQIDDKLRTCKSKKRVSTAKESIPQIKEAMKLADLSNAATRRLAEAVRALLEFGDSLGSLNNDKLDDFEAEILEWSAGKCKILLDSEDVNVQRMANNTLGQYHLSLATSLLGEFEQEDEDFEPDLSSKNAKKARKSLTTAIEYLEKGVSDTDPQSYVQTAEALISLGNLRENESAEQRADYSKAVKLLKKAQRTGAGSFHDLIDSLE